MSAIVLLGASISSRGASATPAMDALGPDTVGYVGCSNTQMSVQGYHRATGNLNYFWPRTTDYDTGSGTIDRWADPDDALWSKFDAKVQREGQPTAIWVQLCEGFPRTGTLPYSDLQQMFANLRDHSPEAVFFASPITLYDPKVGLCSMMGNKGVDDSISFTDRVVGDGLALRGPDTGPLTISNTKPDDPCHPTAETINTLLGPQLIGFFDDPNIWRRQSITFSDIADRTYGDPDFDPGATASSGLTVSYASAGSCSIVGGLVHIDEAGSCTVTASQPGDTDHDPAPDVSRTFAVAPATTTTTLDPLPPSAQYSDQVALEAHVSTGGGTASGPVEFFENGASLGTATPSEGVATLSWPVMLAPKAKPYQLTAAFQGDHDHLASASGAQTLVVTREDARVTLASTQLVYVADASATSATVTLTATVRDVTAVPTDPVTDPFPGDVAHATVSFVNRLTGTLFTGCANRVVQPANPADPEVGTVSCTTMLTTAGVTGLGVAEDEVGFIVNGYYARNTTVEDMVLTLATPRTTAYATGAGEIATASSAGSHAADPGTVADVGFGARPKGGSALGNVLVIVRSGGHVYRITGKAVTSFADTPPDAGETVGPATIQDVTTPGAALTVDTNATVTMWVTDGGGTGPGRAAVEVLDQAGALWFSSDWDGVQTVTQDLVSGAVHVQ